MSKRKSFLLRMSPDLWEEISRWASDELRSVNGHVEYLLREAVRARRSGRAKPPDPGAGDPPEDRGAREGPDAP